MAEARPPESIVPLSDIGGGLADGARRVGPDAARHLLKASSSLMASQFCPPCAEAETAVPMTPARIIALKNRVSRIRSAPKYRACFLCNFSDNLSSNRFNLRIGQGLFLGLQVDRDRDRFLAVGNARAFINVEQ